MEKENKILRWVNIGIIALNSILMLLLCRTISLHYDEAYSIGMINRSYMEIVEFTSNDVHTPFYYFALKAFCSLFGPYHMQAAKLFSAVFFEVFLILGGWFCRKKYNRRVEMYWLIVAGFMPPMVIQATNIRMYGLGFFTFTLAAIMAYEALQSNKWKYWIIFTVASVISMYIHTFSMIEVMVLYIILFVAILRQKKIKALLPYVISGGTAALSYVPWLVVLWHQMRRWTGAEEGWTNNMEELTFFTADKLLAEWFSALDHPKAMAVLFGISLLIYISVYTRNYVKETKDKLPNMGLLIVGAVTAIGIAISVFVVRCFLGRYVFPAFGLVWLFVAVGMDQVQEKWKKIVIISLVLICGLSAYKEEYRLEEASGLQEYIQFIEENVEEGDVIMANNFTSAMISVYLPEREYMVYGNIPNGVPFANMTVFRDWEQLEGVDTVWYLTLNPGMSGLLGEYFQWEPALEFDYSYYTFYVEKASRIR